MIENTYICNVLGLNHYKVEDCYWLSEVRIILDQEIIEYEDIIKNNHGNVEDTDVIIL